MPSVADGTQEQTDVTLSGTSAETPKTYTKEELDKATRDAKAAALADVGRMQAEANKALKAATAAQERLAAMNREREEAEVEAAKDEPDKLVAIRAKQQARKAQTELEQANAELSEARAKLNEFSSQNAEAKKQSTAQKIASEHGVDAAMLTKLAKFTDGTAEAIEDIAKSLPKAKKQEEEGSTFVPDSNRHRGGTPLNIQKVRENYASGRMTTPQYMEQCKALGVQP